MVWKAFYTPLILLAAVLGIAKGNVYIGSVGEAAAQCLTLQEECTPTLTAIARTCVPGAYVARQPGECVRTACAYCEKEDNMLRNECQGWAINAWCPYDEESEEGAAARCLDLQEMCGGWLTAKAEYCAAGVRVGQQPDKCVKAACRFCGRPQNKLYPECNSWAVREWCPFPNSPEMTMEPSTSPIAVAVTPQAIAVPPDFFPRSCIVRPDSGRVVITMRDVPPTGRWTRAPRYGGLTWRANDNRTWVSPPGSGELCFQILFLRGGRYFLTAKTSAPDKQEHNDMWLRFSAGLHFYNAGSYQPFPIEFRAPNSYFKAYQNIGENRLTKVISTINGQPHILVSNAVSPNRRYVLCMAGRSSRFTVYSLIMIRCSGLNCQRTSDYIHQNLRNNTASPCIDEL